MAGGDRCGREVVEMEGGSAVGEEGLEPLNECRGYASLAQVVDEAGGGYRGEGLGDIQKEDGGVFLPPPCIFNFLHQVEDGVGGISPRAAPEVVRGKKIVLFCHHGKFTGHYGLDNLAKGIFQSNWPIGLWD